MNVTQCPETGREIRSLTDGTSFSTVFYPTCCTWTCDGQHILYETTAFGPDSNGILGERQIQEAHVETGRIKWLATIPFILRPRSEASDLKTSSLYHCDYAPNVDRIFFQDVNGHRLFSLNRTTGKVNEIWQELDGTIGDPPSCTSDGSRIAFYVIFPGPHKNRYFSGITSAILLLDINPETGERIGEPRMVTAFVGRTATPRNIYVNHCQINSTHPDQIIFAHEFGGCPYDGSLLRERIWFVNSDGTNEHPLVRGAHGRYHTHEVIGASGEWLYYVDTGGLCRVHIATHTVEAIVPPGHPERLWHINVSPDEKWVVADTEIFREKTPEGLWMSSLVLVNVETGEMQRVCRFPCRLKHPAHPHPNFSPDGRKIAFVVGTPTGSSIACCDVSDLI